MKQTWYLSFCEFFRGTQHLHKSSEQMDWIWWIGVLRDGFRIKSNVFTVFLMNWKVCICYSLCWIHSGLQERSLCTVNFSAVLFALLFMNVPTLIKLPVYAVFQKPNLYCLSSVIPLIHLCLTVPTEHCLIQILPSIIQHRGHFHMYPTLQTRLPPHPPLTGHW